MARSQSDLPPAVAEFRQALLKALQAPPCPFDDGTVTVHEDATDELSGMVRIETYRGSERREHDVDYDDILSFEGSPIALATSVAAGIRSEWSGL